MISNYNCADIRPGSMGRPLPGIQPAIVHRKEDGTVEIENNPSTEGELALKPGWPSMFRGYIHDDERYKKCFVDGWYITGDLAERDEDGYFWFIGRADDIIKTAGHMVGPFEVESALMGHPAVSEVGVIGKPDPVDRRAGQGLCSAQAGLRLHRRAAGRAAGVSGARNWARRSLQRRSSSSSTCQRRAAARSCAGC